MPEVPHLTPLDLLGLYAHEIDPKRRRELVGHLACGCKACSELALSRPWPEPCARLGTENEPEQRAALEAVQEFRVRRVVKSVLAIAKQFDEARKQAFQELAGEIPLAGLGQAPLPTQTLLWARAEAWLDHARSLRREDPEGCLFSAVLATCFSMSLESKAHPPTEFGNLVANTWGELANARRLTGDSTGAEAAFFRAITEAQEFESAAGIAEHAARHLQAAQQFDAAESLFQEIQRGYKAAADHHGAGRVALYLGTTARLRQDLGGALHHYLESLRLLDLERDPALTLAAFHNVIHCAAQLGHFDVAQEWLERCAPMYEEHGGAMDQLRRRWVEGFIEAGLGNLPRADGLLRGVREEFEDRDLSYQAALVTLDLCTVWLRRGKFRELVCGVDEAVSTFTALKIGREALAGLLLLQEAARAEQATVALIQAAVGALRAERP